MSFEACQEENTFSALLDAMDVDCIHTLWRAVLKRTIRDAASKRLVPIRHNAQWGVTGAEQADARACLADVEWCEVMCERAGIDVGWFRDHMGRSEYGR